MAYVRDQNGNIVYDQSGNALTSADGEIDGGGEGGGVVDTDWVAISLPSSSWSLNPSPTGTTWTDI